MSLIPVESRDITASVPIDHEAILKAFNINARDPKAQAMILACQKYGLDPLLKHAVLISGNLYVTRDGLLAVAHRSGLLDGIVIEDEGETASEWWAKVTVHVKDVKYGYTYRGRYPKDGQLRKYGPEMAVKVAEVMALRRAFGVTGVPTVEEQWDKADALAVSELATTEHMARIDELLPQVPQDAMPELKAWKAEAGISMKAGEFTAEMADDVIAKLEELAVTDAEIVTESAPDPEAPVAPPTVEPDTGTAGVEVGTAPVGGSSTPGGENVTGGEGSTVSESAEASDSRTAPTPSGDAPTPLKVINERGYQQINRKCRAIQAEHFPADDQSCRSKDPLVLEAAQPQWTALNHACSGGRARHLSELTPDEASVFRTRCIDLAEGRATWTATGDDPQWLGWTLNYGDEVAA